MIDAKETSGFFTRQLINVFAFLACRISLKYIYHIVKLRYAEAYCVVTGKVEALPLFRAVYFCMR